MKKILSIFMAVLMLAGLCTVTAFADFTIGGDKGLAENDLVSPNNQTSSVDVKINLDGTVVHKYAIDVVFGDLLFSYGATSTWNPENHTYDVDSTNSKWACVSGADEITIRNHSDLPVTYKAANSALNTLYGKLELTIKNAEGTATGEIEACPVGATTAPSDTLTVAVSGTPSGLTKEAVTLSTITVTITPAPETSEP